MSAAAVEFDEATHTYRAGGVLVPGVTSILKPLVDYSHIPERKLLAKSEIGRAAHLATEIDDDGLRDPALGLDEDTVHPKVRPYLDAYRKWRHEMGVRPISSEEIVFHPLLRYAGMFDLIAEIAGQRWLIDKKCTADVNPVWAVQTAAYREAHPERDRLKRAALHLRDDGTYRWIPYDKPENAMDFQVFLGLLNAHHWRLKHGV